jgi:hypothetical protein
MNTTTKTVTVRLLHESSIPGARWCEPIGWKPSNEIEGAEFSDGSYWEETEEVAGFVCFADGCKEDEIEVSLDDLRIASCGDCKVLGKVVLA